MNEYEWNKESWRKDQADLEERMRQQAAAHEAWWKERIAGRQDEILKRAASFFGAELDRHYK